MSTQKNTRPRSWLGSLLSGMWRGIDSARRFAVNVLFIVIIVFLLGLMFSGDGPTVPRKAALVLDPEGVIVEQLSGDPAERAIGKLTGSTESEVLARDLIDAIDRAREDDRIQALVLDLNDLSGGGLSKLQEIGDALDRFRDSGKKVVAAADIYDDARYYLAAHADEVHMHPGGMLMLQGFGRFRTYYKNAIDRFEVDWNVFKVGEFKSAVEPFLRNDMSDAAREANLEWLGDLWRIYRDDVVAARGLDAGAIQAFTNGFGDRLREAGGIVAQVALEANLVDHLSHRDEVKDRLIEIVGEDEGGNSFARIGFEDYLQTLDRSEPLTGDLVAVVVAKGTILDGEQSPGAIGGDSTAALIRKARRDDRVKAVVLRVDSGGGSAFASEVIRRECELTRDAGKPVVVSMGTLAASGGYWISTSSDEIWASPSTITGSIGIFAMFPTFQKPLEELGVRVDGVGTTEMAGSLRLDRELSPKVGETIQMIVDRGYQDFLERVATARDKTPEEVDEIAQGRVWSGQDAHELGLVDRLGGLPDAIASAAERASLGDDFGVSYVEKELDFEERLVVDMLSQANAWFGPLARRTVAAPSLSSRIMRFAERQAGLLEQFNDPRGVYAHCMCEVD